MTNNQQTSASIRIDANNLAAYAEVLFGTDSAIGVQFRMEDGAMIASNEFDARYSQIDRELMPECESLMPDGTSATVCTNYARHVRSVLSAHGFAVEIVGFANENNPLSRCAQQEFHPEGHDFAVVNSRFLVDPWVRLVAAVEDQIIYDLANPSDAAKALDLYGPSHCWQPLGC